MRRLQKQIADLSSRLEAAVDLALEYDGIQKGEYYSNGNDKERLSFLKENIREIFKECRQDVRAIEAEMSSLKRRIDQLVFLKRIGRFN